MAPAPEASEAERRGEWWPLIEVKIQKKRSSKSGSESLQQEAESETDTN